MASLFAIIHPKSITGAFGQEARVNQDDLFKVPIESQADQLNSFTEEAFVSHLNTTFRIYTSSLTVINIKLIEVRRWEPASSVNAAKTTNMVAFGLMFRGPRRRPFESGTYRVEHDQMGTFQLFINPVNDHKKERRYESVFNRLPL